MAFVASCGSRKKALREHLREDIPRVQLISKVSRQRKLRFLGSDPAVSCRWRVECEKGQIKKGRKLGEHCLNNIWMTCAAPGSLQSSSWRAKRFYLISQENTEVTHIWERNESDEELKVQWVEGLILSTFDKLNMKWNDIGLISSSLVWCPLSSTIHDFLPFT